MPSCIFPIYTRIKPSSSVIYKVRSHFHAQPRRQCNGFLMIVQEPHSLLEISGVIDPFKKLCLIDPQSHTYVASRVLSYSGLSSSMLISCYVSAGPRNSQQDIYWDLKNKGINLFFQEHDTACSRNPFCNFLDLRNLHFEKPDSQGSQSEGDDEDEDESEEKQGEDRVSKGTGSEAEEDDDRQDVGAQ